MSELSNKHVHREGKEPLEKILEKQKIGGISGIDTRHLVKIIRNKGTIPALLSVYDDYSIDFVKQVIANKPELLNPNGKKTVALIDYGLKRSIAQELVKRGVKVVILPATITASEILQYSPDGIVLSNGPKDPRDYVYAIQTIKELLKTNIPIFGICLGHQLLALAAGGEIFKLKFGHRGLNQPVFQTGTKKAFITSQNHGYAINKGLLPKNWEVSFSNLNDGTIEGLKHKRLPFFSVQFHPEANPGPKDTNFLFDIFLNYL
jgi:carbamoyl-phosphate synthase small subunit